MNIIEVKNLAFGYSQTPLLNDLSFAVEEGSFLAIAGPNGVGKSTLLNLLSSFLKPRSGSIAIDVKPLKEYTTTSLAGKVAMVRQEFVPAFGFSVIETVMMARTRHFGQLGFDTEEDRRIVTDALEATDTADLASRQLSNISGGERQRVFIARALAQQTPILLLDEPTSFLDLKHQVRVYDLLKKMQLEQNKTVVAITHDINLAAQYCDQVLLLAEGARYHQGSAEDVFAPERIEEVFGVTGMAGYVQSARFFLPLGKYSLDYRAENDISDC